MHVRSEAVQFVSLFHIPSSFVDIFRQFGLEIDCFAAFFFAAFKVSFLFEAFVVSFSTLLHYNYCRVSHLLSDHCDHGCR